MSWVKHVIALTALSVMLMPLFNGCASWRQNRDGGLFGLGASNSENQNEDPFDVTAQRDPDRLLLEDLAPSNIATTFKTRTLGDFDRDTAEAKMAEGRAIYDRAVAARQNPNNGEEASELFLDAAKSFREAAAYWPQSSLEHDALFWMGESYYFADHYVQANRAYEYLIVRYSGTRHLDKVEARRFTIAQYWLKRSDKSSSWALGMDFTDPKRPTKDIDGEARRILHRIRLDDPTGKLADDAALALANAYFKAGRYIEAADTYEDLRRNYPGSSHQFRAHVLEMRSRLESYHGADYDSTALEQADRLMKAIVRQFPSEFRENETYFAREAARIRTMLAERDWKMARYFEKRGENRAASIYYKEVADNFSDTSLADDAQERAGDLASKPPLPPQYAQWLVDIFPEPKATKPLIASGDNESILR